MKKRIREKKFKQALEKENLFDGLEYPVSYKVYFDLSRLTKKQKDQFLNSPDKAMNNIPTEGYIWPDPETVAEMVRFLNEQGQPYEYVVAPVRFKYIDPATDEQAHPKQEA